MLYLSSDAPLLIEAAEGDDATPRRTLTGQAVPHNVTARVSTGQLVKFLPGSIDLAGAPVIRDHDTTRPVGIVIAASDTATGHAVSVRLSQTPSGDETLILAADQVLRGFSVGVEPTEYTIDSAGPEPVMVVAAATTRELSLLINPAYGAASSVTHVAASNQPDTKDIEPMENSTPTNADQAPVAAATATPGPVDIATAAPVAVVRSEPVQLTAGEFVVESILAQRGDRTAAARIQAALDPQDTTGNIGVVPDQYLAGIVGGLAPYRPAYASVTNASLPSKGDSLVRPVWETLPVVEKYPTQGAEPPTGAVAIGNATIDKDSWAHAVVASLALINRSDPSYAQAYFTQAVLSYYGALDADLTDQLVTAGGVAATGYPTAAPSIASAVAACVNAQVDASGIFRGYWPTWAMVGMTVWSDLIGTSLLDGAAFSSGSITLDTPSGSLSGLQIRANPALAAEAIVVGTPAAATVYEGSQLQLRALVVNTMSMELGFMQDTAFHVAYPAAIKLGGMSGALAARTVRASKD